MDHHGIGFPVFAETDTLCILDLTVHLKQHPGRPYHVRPQNTELLHIFLHHTAGSIKPHYTGPQETHKHCMADKYYVWQVRTPSGKWETYPKSVYLNAPPERRRRVNAGGRGWAGIPYHFWVPYDIEHVPSSGKMIVYCTLDPSYWSWHTKGTDENGLSNNEHGLSVVMQGAFASSAAPDPRPRGTSQTTPHPNPVQLMVTNSLLLYLHGRYMPNQPATALSCHAWVHKGAKPACPGMVGEALVRTTRTRLVAAG